MLANVASFLFVVVWSSGFVAARAVAPHAAPELVLLARMGLTALVLGGTAVAFRQKLPPRRRLLLHLLAGALLNGLYLCSSWWAVANGMPVGIMALLGATQPLIVAIAAFLLLHDRLPSTGWIGLGVGLGGVVLVLLPLLGGGIGHSVSTLVIGAALASICAMAAGTLIQGGSIAQDDLCMAGAVQNAGGAAVAAAVTGLTADVRWDNSPVLWLALAWSVLMLSVVALSLLVWMTRHQGATRVSLLLLLIPPFAAVEARIVFGEQLTDVQLVGFAVALGGTLLARRRAGTRVAERGETRDPLRDGAPLR